MWEKLDSTWSDSGTKTVSGLIGELNSTFTILNSIRQEVLISSIANYPNPFNQTRSEGTKIEFKLYQQATIKISIYTMAGGLIREWEFEESPTNLDNYTLTQLWDGTNAQGRLVANGPYTLVISATSKEDGSTKELRRVIAVAK